MKQVPSLDSNWGPTQVFPLKILSRVFLYNSLCFSDLPLIPPTCEGLPPTGWWDADADKSLLVGTFKHGFERYNMMRLDPALCFLAKCGPPDNAAVQVYILPEN